MRRVGAQHDGFQFRACFPKHHNNNAGSEGLKPLAPTCSSIKQQHIFLCILLHLLVVYGVMYGAHKVLMGLHAGPPRMYTLRRDFSNKPLGPS